MFSTAAAPTVNEGSSFSTSSPYVFLTRSMGMTKFEHSYAKFWKPCLSTVLRITWDNSEVLGGPGLNDFLTQERMELGTTSKRMT